MANKQQKRKKRTGYHTSTPRTSGVAEGDRQEASLTRTKRLLLAALRVWELKHRISD